MIDSRAIRVLESLAADMAAKGLGFGITAEANGTAKIKLLAGKKSAEIHYDGISIIEPSCITGFQYPAHEVQIHGAIIRDHLLTMLMRA